MDDQLLDRFNSGVLFGGGEHELPETLVFNEQEAPLAHSDLYDALVVRTRFYLRNCAHIVAECCQPTHNAAVATFVGEEAHRQAASPDFSR